MSATANDVADVLRTTLADSDLVWVEHGGRVFEVDLPGERKLKTTCRLEVGKHALGVHAFVARRPDENHEVVYRWMLERNLRMFGVAFAVDAAGDIYLDYSKHRVTDETLRLLLALARDCGLR